ncbi:MAG: hypothetical protein JWO75_496, partial [Actinomycetia bacterium]|nr:hypothetical protein [Actinomycetes bacterium]
MARPGAPSGKARTPAPAAGTQNSPVRVARKHVSKGARAEQIGGYRAQHAQSKATVRDGTSKLIGSSCSRHCEHPGARREQRLSVGHERSLTCVYVHGLPALTCRRETPSLDVVSHSIWSGVH